MRTRLHLEDQSQSLSNRHVTAYRLHATKRSKTRLNAGWRFHLGDVPGAAQENLDDSTWEAVHVPHTFELTSLSLDDCTDDKTQPTFHREIGWYRIALTDLNRDPEKKAYLEFEGVHQVTECWVNGQHVGKHAIGGFTPFHFDISSFVRRDGTDRVALWVDNVMPG